jgi:hypothetical protein
MDDSEKLGAAFHEAAHAAAIGVLGGTVQEVWIRFGGDAWEGETPMRWNEPGGPMRLRKSWVSAVSGPLGQVKYRARLAWPGAVFDREVALQNWLPVIREGDLEAGTGLGFSFLAGDGTKHRMDVVDFDDLGDFERLDELSKGLEDGEVLHLLEEACGLVDRCDAWAAIMEIADVLHRNDRLSGDAAHVILRRHGI